MIMLLVWWLNLLSDGPGPVLLYPVDSESFLYIPQIQNRGALMDIDWFLKVYPVNITISQYLLGLSERILNTAFGL